MRKSEASASSFFFFFFFGGRAGEGKGRGEEGGFRLIKHGTNEKVNRDNTVGGKQGGREGGGPGCACIGNVELHHDRERKPIQKL